MGWMIVSSGIFLMFMVVSVFPQNLARGASCLTPNNERATCIPVNSCNPIKEAVLAKKPSAISFAQKSQCGYDKGALVCCGSTGLPVSTIVFGNTNPSQSSGSVKPFQHKLLPDVSVCGLERHDDRVFGGERTDLDEFPWIALLKYQDADGDAGYRCGGSLINQRYVLTAAHCVVVNINTGLSLDNVRLGEWKISTKRDCLGQKNLRVCADPIVDVGIQSTVAHPYYNRRSRDNDIALIRLARNIVYTDFIRPICIPSHNTQSPAAGTNLILAGWGATENSSHSDLKLKVRVPVVSQSQCATRLKNRGLISENQVCAGGVEGKDSCQGDSGGPLMRIVEDNPTTQYQWFLEGVISWGVGCGIEGFPGVYTKVSKYSNWIVNNIDDF